MTSIALTETGLTNFTLDGSDVQLPNTYEPQNVLRQAIENTFNGRRRLDVPDDGTGLPDVPDLWEWAFDYDIDDSNASSVKLTLERLRATGGTHLFVDWIRRLCRWTALSGQTIIYLPRPDAYSKSYDGHTAVTEKAIVSVNGTPISEANVLYEADVTEATSVVAGKIKISTTSISHPDSGATVARAKFGTALTANDIVEVQYHPLFSVAVTGVPTKPFASLRVGREDKALFLIETT